MSYIIAFLSLMLGTMGLLKPEFFYKHHLLTEKQINRNNRIWRRGGVFFIICGILDLVLTMLNRGR